MGKFKSTVPRREITEPIETDYVVFDFETTGPCTPGDEILEIGAVKCDRDGNIISHFSALVNPTCEIDSYPQMITGITEEKVRDCPPLREVFPKFLDFIGDLPLVGHGIKGFDLRFLDYTCEYMNLPFVDNPYLDTVKFCKALVSKHETNGKFSVEALVSLFKLPRRQAHRAMSDTLMEKDVYVALCNRYRKKVDFIKAQSSLPVAVEKPFVGKPAERREPDMISFTRKDSVSPDLLVRLGEDSATIEICTYIPELREYVKTNPSLHWVKDGNNRWYLRLDGPLGAGLISFGAAMATIRKRVSVVENNGQLCPVNMACRV